MTLSPLALALKREVNYDCALSEGVDAGPMGFDGVRSYETILRKMPR